MVIVAKKQSSNLGVIPAILAAFTLFAALVWTFEEQPEPVTAGFHKAKPPAIPKASVSMEATFDQVSGAQLYDAQNAPHCPYQSLDDLRTEERYPERGDRHMVTPPEGGLVHLVCCKTTKGPINAVVHEKWAPLGAKRFLQMVKSGYFNAGVPLMRCIKGFLCQFGLNSNPKLSRVFQETIPDDPNWLPEGPKYRTNSKGVARFAVGYLAYAGSEKNSRDNQLIVSLDNVPTLAGGSPWEVPWGELVGTHSFDTLAKFYTGYGEDGPEQNTVWRIGMGDNDRKKFPDLDYIEACEVVDQEIQLKSDYGSSEK